MEDLETNPPTLVTDRSELVDPTPTKREYLLNDRHNIVMALLALANFVVSILPIALWVRLIGAAVGGLLVGTLVQGYWTDVFIVHARNANRISRRALRAVNHVVNNDDGRRG